MPETGKPLHIIHIITGLTLGGAQQLLLDTARGMVARGQHVQLIGLYPGVLAEEGRAQGMTVDELSLRGFVHFPTLWQLVRLLKRYHPDVVHTHQGKADTYGRLAAKLAGVPVIVTTAHSTEEWKRNPLLLAIDRFTSRFADRIVGCSAAVTQHVVNVGGLPAKQVITIPNGIELAQWQYDPSARAQQRAALGCTDDDYLIGVVARIEPEKGHPDFLRAVRALHDAGLRVKVLLVGDGTQRPAIEALVDALSLRAYVHFTGARRDVRQLYPAMDLAVLPSTREGFGLALIEAMAAQRPVIGTETGGIPEIIQHEDNGLLVPPGEITALASAMQRCYEDRAWAAQLAQRGSESVHARYSIMTVVDRLLALYREILATKPARQP